MKVEYALVMVCVLLIVIALLAVGFDFVSKSNDNLRLTMTPEATLTPKPIYWVEQMYYDPDLGVACYGKCYEVTVPNGSHVCDPINCISTRVCK